MYIIVKRDPEAPVAISRKLHKALNLKANPDGILGAISISQMKGTNQVCIIRRKPEETFQQQCCLVSPHPSRDRRTPSVFHWTVPSLEFIKAVSGLQITNSVVIKVKPTTLANGMTIYVLQI